MPKARSANTIKVLDHFTKNPTKVLRKETLVADLKLTYKEVDAALRTLTRSGEVVSTVSGNYVLFVPAPKEDEMPQAIKNLVFNAPIDSLDDPGMLADMEMRIDELVASRSDGRIRVSDAKPYYEMRQQAAVHLLALITLVDEASSV